MPQPIFRALPPALPLLATLAVLIAPATAGADEPLQLRFSYAGNADFFATGATMAVDGPDADADVDSLLHPAVTSITDADIPAGVALRQAYLYWAGSIENADCDGSTIDDQVTFTAPGQPAGPVVAEVCYCSDAGAAGYDMQLCRADISNLLEDLTGDYAVDDFDALIENGTTNAASFSVVLVYNQDDLPNRRIALYDGLLTMVNSSTTVMLEGLEVDDPPQGDLTWYAIEGDLGGLGNEAVSVSGLPGGGMLALFDAINPVSNPMNHTINTTTPPQADAVGVDIDEFDISAALTTGDQSVETTYLAGSDKYWIGYNIVGINVFAPVLATFSNKTWTLQDDADQSGGPSPGDVIRYVIALENSGNAPALVTLEDPIPAEAASWTLIDAGGGVDASTADTLIVDAIALPIGAATEVIFDLTLAEVADGTVMINVASWSAPPNGGSGDLVAPPVVVDIPGAGDTGDSGDSSDTSGDSSDTAGDSSDSSGESESDGGSSSDGGNDDVGSESDSAGAGPSVDDGCGCVGARPGDGLPGSLALLGLLGLLGRRRRL